MDNTHHVTTAGPAPLFGSEVTIEFAAEPPKAFLERSATIPGLEQPLVYGVREPWNAIYGTQPGEFPTRPTTNDVFVASVGACMAGTFGGILDARGITLTSANCTVEVIAQIGPPDQGTGSHIVRSVHVTFRLRGFDDLVQRNKIDRVHALVHRECWLSQTLVGSRCAVTSSVEYLQD